MNLNRDDGFELLQKYVKSDSLIKHSLSVEAAMRHFADIFNEDIELWGLVGLLHDIDYELYPEEHCTKVYEILTNEGYPKDFIDSISSHGYGIMPNVEVEPRNRMEKTLYMVDEMTGLITASVLVRPSKSILDIKAKSVNKKWKDKAFAKNISRETITKGLDMLGMDRTEAINETIAGLSKACDVLDLRGNI